MVITMKKIPTRFSSFAFAAFALQFGSQVLAANYTWNNTTTDWGTSTAWSPSGPPTSADTAIFNSTSYAFQPSLGANQNVIRLTFGDGATSTAAITISPGGAGNTLTIG